MVRGEAESRLKSPTTNGTRKETETIVKATFFFRRAFFFGWWLAGQERRWEGRYAKSLVLVLGSVVTRKTKTHTSACTLIGLTRMSVSCDS